MAFESAAAYLSIASAAAGTYFTVDQARQKNKALEKRYESEQEAAEVQSKQVQRQGETEKTKRRERVERISGRLRVAGGEAGIGLGGSIEALQRQNDIDLARNNTIINQNTVDKIALIQSGLDASRIQYQSQVQNELLAGIAGGVQGFSTGLSISQGISDIQEMNQTPVPDPYVEQQKPQP